MAADEAVLNKVKKSTKNPHLKNHIKWEAGTGRTLLTVVLLRGLASSYCVESQGYTHHPLALKTVELYGT